VIYTLLHSAKLHILLADYLAAKCTMHYWLMQSKLTREGQEREGEREQWQGSNDPGRNSMYRKKLCSRIVLAWVSTSSEMVLLNNQKGARARARARGASLLANRSTLRFLRTKLRRPPSTTNSRHSAPQRGRWNRRGRRRE
jgi:hypothetical protein